MRKGPMIGALVFFVIGVILIADGFNQNYVVNGGLIGAAGIWVIILGTLPLLVIGLRIKPSNKNPLTSETKQPQDLPHTNSMEILKTRYAKGEITKEQFDQMKKDLE